MKKLILSLSLIFLYLLGFCQHPGFDKNYVFIKSGNLVADKNFYLITVIQNSKPVKDLLSQNPVLNEFLQKKIQEIKDHTSDTITLTQSLLNDFRFSSADSNQIQLALKESYNQNHEAWDKIINQHLRPSGYYIRYNELSNGDFLAKAWNQYLYGINYIVDQFGLGKKMRYPSIDSPNYKVNSRAYRYVLKDMFSMMDEQGPEMKVFYQPYLSMAMNLMDINDRDEPARFEPMEKTENRKAYEHIKIIHWEKYSYACIVIPGMGPSLTTTPISPDGKIHCEVAAAEYLRGKAPFIITSGGYCYPFRGPYCEAIEMKKFLMSRYGIPEEAILIDPHARHTTTNMRNANRIMIRYGIPISKPSLVSTAKYQHDYIMNTGFDRRNMKELGYLPYSGKKSISNHSIEYYPVYESLQMDPLDPLDP